MDDVSQNQQNSGGDERDRGILAPVDRKYIHGEKSYAHRQSEYDRKEKIKERIRNGVLDFSILAHVTDEELIEEAVGDYPENQEMQNALIDVILFVYRVTSIHGFTETLGTGGKNQHFGQMLERAVRGGFLKENHVVDDFEYSTRTTHIPDLQTMIDKAEEGESLSPAFIHYILTHDVVDDDIIQEAAREQLKSISTPEKE